MFSGEETCASIIPVDHCNSLKCQKKTEVGDGHYRRQILEEQN